MKTIVANVGTLQFIGIKMKQGFSYYYYYYYYYYYQHLFSPGHWQARYLSRFVTTPAALVSYVEEGHSEGASGVREPAAGL